MPVWLELSSLDGVWAFAGEVRHRYRLDVGWMFHSVDPGLEAASYDVGALGPEAHPACSNEIRLSIELGYWHNGGALADVAELKAFCPDGSVQRLYTGSWYGEARSGEGS